MTMLCQCYSWHQHHDIYMCTRLITTSIELKTFLKFVYAPKTVLLTHRRFYFLVNEANTRHCELPMNRLTITSIFWWIARIACLQHKVWRVYNTRYDVSTTQGMTCLQHKVWRVYNTRYDVSTTQGMTCLQHKVWRVYNTRYDQSITTQGMTNP